jgi:RNA polymerase sigma factor (sigma-70 family)
MDKAKALSEDQLLYGLRHNDESIMNRLYRLYYPMVSHFIITNGGLEEEAKDIYQEAFIVLYENLQDSEFVLSCKIKTYLYSIARRLWLKRFSYKTKYQSELKDSEEYVQLYEDHTEIVQETEFRFATMEQGLEKLGEPCRTIIRDYYINEMNMVQIAEKMGYTNADNAKNQKYKCLMRLKKIVENTQAK